MDAAFPRLKVVQLAGRVGVASAAAAAVAVGGTVEMMVDNGNIKPQQRVFLCESVLVALQKRLDRRQCVSESVFLGMGYIQVCSSSSGIVEVKKRQSLALCVLNCVAIYKYIYI